MRFAVAATILANSLPATFRPNGAVEARQESTALWRSLLHVPASDRLQIVKPAIAARRRKLGTLGMLKNSVSLKASHAVECDPDVGILACGFGKSCISNPGSSLGGVCVPVTSDSQRALQSSYGNPMLTTDRPVINDTYTITGASVYCDPSSSFYGELECDCTDWALESRTGAIDCKLKSASCYEGCNQTCYSIDFSYNTDGSSLSYEYCFEFVSPFEQSFCFGYTNNQTCMISVDGNSCSSCYTSYQLNCETGTCISETCSNFQCDNLNLGAGNSCYDAFIPPSFYECYLKINDMYPKCSICPNDAIAHPEVYFDLPGYGSFNCSHISSLATSGRLNPQQCSYAPTLAASACCEGGEDPVYICNICGEDDHVITLSNAMIDFPGQPSVSCEGLHNLADQGKIDETQCGIVESFVVDTCGCMPKDDIQPTISPGPGSAPSPTEDNMPESSAAKGSVYSVFTPAGVTVALSTIALMVLSVLAN